MASGWLSDWLIVKFGDRIFEERPMLSFLKPVPDRGTHKSKESTKPLLKDKKFDVARRKSIACGYLNGGTGSNALNGKEGKEGKAGNHHHNASCVDMEFDISSLTSPASFTSSSIMSRPISPTREIDNPFLNLHRISKYGVNNRK
jgi:hypothetical protein